MHPASNFSVERIAASGICLQIRPLAVRRHRSPLRSVEVEKPMNSKVCGSVVVGTTQRHTAVWTDKEQHPPTSLWRL
jgi:hypothetical protein